MPPDCDREYPICAAHPLPERPIRCRDQPARSLTTCLGGISGALVFAIEGWWRRPPGSGASRPGEHGVRYPVHTAAGARGAAPRHRPALSAVRKIHVVSRSVELPGPRFARTSAAGHRSSASSPTPSGSWWPAGPLRGRRINTERSRDDEEVHGVPMPAVGALPGGSAAASAGIAGHSDRACRCPEAHAVRAVGPGGRAGLG